MRDAKLKYNIMEKQFFALVKALKDFRVYVHHIHVTWFVPNAFVKDISSQLDNDGRRGKWISRLLEYDLEIKPMKLIKGQGIARMMTETNCDTLGINFFWNFSIN